jgi:hypothetical protein
VGVVDEGEKNVPMCCTPAVNYKKKEFKKKTTLSLFVNAYRTVLIAWCVLCSSFF